MENNILHISEDAPPELKETVAIAQRMLDNMLICKQKADAGQLTMADLEELTRRNNVISGEFPRARQQPAGYPPLTSDMNQLEAIAAKRSREDQNLLKQQGGPVIQLDSMEQLERLSKMSPEKIEALILKAAAKKKKKGLQPDTRFVSSAHQQKIDFKNDLIGDLLDEITYLLFCSKRIYFDLHDNWTDAARYEEPLREKLLIYRGYGKEGKHQILAILHQDEKDENLLEKTLEAALALLSWDWDSCADLDELLAVWQKNSDLAPLLIKALQYSKNPALSSAIERKLMESDSQIKPGLIKALEYRAAIDEVAWATLLEHREPALNGNILRAFVNNNLSVEKRWLDELIEDPESEIYEDSLLTNLLSGNEKALPPLRKFLTDKPDKVKRLPLSLACAGNASDFNLLKLCLEKKNSRLSAIRALGMLGLPQAIPLLIRLFPKTLKKKEQWELCLAIARSLELITGAGLTLSFPDVREGPEGKEHEITVAVDFHDEWLVWHHYHQDQFSPEIRYRRGQPFTLESCIREMAFLKGNYWSRQSSFYELQIRSGRHTAPFFADWDVDRQVASIETWRQWWQDSQHHFGKDQWLFAGRPM